MFWTLMFSISHWESWLVQVQFIFFKYYSLQYCIIRVANFQTLVWDLRLFVILQTFPRLLLYMLKTMTFSHFITKQSASILEFQYFYSVLQMNFCEPRQKREERPFSAGTSCVWAGLWPAVTRTLSTLQSFQTFLRHNVGNPVYN